MLEENEISYEEAVEIYGEPRNDCPIAPQTHLEDEALEVEEKNEIS